MEALQVQPVSYSPIVPIAPLQVEIQKKIYHIPRPTPPFIPLLFKKAPKSYRIPFSHKKPHSDLLIQYPMEEKTFTFAKHRLIAPLKMHPLKGELMRTPDGLHYIKLSDALIAPIAFHFKSLGFRIPEHFGSSKDIGAHIPILLPKEIDQVMIPITEVGQSFYLFYKGIRRQTLSDGESTHTSWYITFEAPALENLRRKYGLFGKLQGEPFHTLLGIKTVETSLKKPILSVSTSCGRF